MANLSFFPTHPMNFTYPGPAYAIHLANLIVLRAEPILINNNKFLPPGTWEWVGILINSSYKGKCFSSAKYVLFRVKPYFSKNSYGTSAWISSKGLPRPIIFFVSINYLILRKKIFIISNIT